MIAKLSTTGLSLLLLAAPASAQLVLTNNVYRETIRTTTDGRATTELAPAARMVPGTTAVYVMTVTNRGARPATNLAINNHVPSGVAYVGPGTEGAQPEVSVDGGRTFGPIASAKTLVAGGATRAATPADVTDVRWTIRGSLERGASASVSYKGRIR